MCFLHFQQDDFYWHSVQIIINISQNLKPAELPDSIRDSMAIFDRLSQQHSL